MIANNLEGVSLDGIEDILKRDLRGWSLEFVSTLWSSHTLNDVPLSEPLKDLLRVRKIDV